MDTLTPSAPLGYTLVTTIGRGASSVVWEAKRLASGTSVALKILEADVSDADAVRRFEREREAMTALARHPNILTIVDAGVEGGRPWLAMELCRRGSLAAHVASDGPLDMPTALRVLNRLAGALAVAHDAGVVHCDIKPANVMLTDAGQPALGDFGIARVSVGRATTTTVGGFSLDHVAPELLDDGKRTPRSDVYSLGTTAWELLVGTPPFRQTADVSVGAVLTRILRQPLPESPRLPDEMLVLLRRMAAKTPEERPAAMQEVAEELRAMATARDVDLGAPAFPALSADQVEVFTPPPVPTDSELAMSGTHRRFYALPDPTGKAGRSRAPRAPLAAAGAAAVLTVVAFGGNAVGAFGPARPNPTTVQEKAQVNAVVPTVAPRARPVTTVEPAPQAPVEQPAVAPQVVVAPPAAPAARRAAIPAPEPAPVAPAPPVQTTVVTVTQTVPAPTPEPQPTTVPPTPEPVPPTPEPVPVTPEPVPVTPEPVPVTPEPVPVTPEPVAPDQVTPPVQVPDQGNVPQVPPDQVTPPVQVPDQGNVQQVPPDQVTPPVQVPDQGNVQQVPPDQVTPPVQVPEQGNVQQGAPDPAPQQGAPQQVAPDSAPQQGAPDSAPQQGAPDPPQQGAPDPAPQQGAPQQGAPDPAPQPAGAVPADPATATAVDGSGATTDQNSTGN